MWITRVLRPHVDNLSSKSYEDTAGITPDYNQDTWEYKCVSLKPSTFACQGFCIILIPMRKPRTTGNPPGRPQALVPRKGQPYYIKVALINMNRNHAIETGRTESAIVEQLLEDYYGYSDGEAIL